MIINYGISCKVDGKIEHKNLKIDLPEIQDANWDKNCRNGYIRKKIEAILEPEWSVSGYAMHNYSIEEDYEYLEELLCMSPEGLDALNRLVKRLRNFELAQKYKLEEPDDRNSQD
jgi:hypothetical protein